MIRRRYKSDRRRRSDDVVTYDDDTLQVSVSAALTKDALKGLVFQGMK